MSTRADGFRHRQVAVGASSLHVVEGGDPEAAPFLFLHGWPESWRTWEPVMEMASRTALSVAIDLPGVGESTGDPTDGSKRQLAETVHQLVAALGLRDLTLVGHDAGGMVAYAYLRAFRDLRRAVIMDTVIPGVNPWDEVLRNPYLWHFAMHQIPELPERLVQGHQREYSTTSTTSSHPTRPGSPTGSARPRPRRTPATPPSPPGSAGIAPSPATPPTTGRPAAPW
jgi:pimeloyl-ACP methyl ester carboxylesterase